MRQGIKGSAMAEWRGSGVVLLPCIAGVTLVAAHGYALGVMIRPLELEFGWPRAQISAGFMIISVMALLFGTAVGRAVDRFGPRRIALVGVPAYCCALASLGFANQSIWSWWALWLILALAVMTILPVVWISILNQHFLHSRGLAMAVALSGTGLAAALFPMIVNALVELVGWRLAFPLFAAGCAAVALPLVVLFFHERVDEARAKSPTGLVRPPVSPAAKAAARAQFSSARFGKLALASFVFAVASCVLTTNMVPVLLGEGLSPASAAATAGLLGVGSVAGRLIGGVLLDRYDGNKVAAASVILPMLPTAILLSTEGSQAWAAFACLIMGLAVGAELDTTAYLTARHFGSRTFGALFGTINGLLLFGAGLAPLGANAVFDMTGSYDPVLIALLPLFIATAFLFLGLGSYRHLDPETGQPMPAALEA